MVTPIQHKVYVFIQQFIQTHGYSPSLQEIALGIGISPRSKSLVSRCVHALADAGMVVLNEGRRNIGLAQSIALPLVGRIAAGAPIEAITHTEMLDIGAMLSGDNLYVLEVRGDSMIEEGILDGDNVICKRQQTADEGDIVVALIDNQDATLKRICFQTKDKITLLPANAELKPQVYPSHRVQIQGVFVGLLRFYKKM